MTEPALLKSDSEGTLETKYLLTNSEAEKSAGSEHEAEQNTSTLAEISPVENMQPPPRRPDIDVIMIFLTYGIYLFHLSVIYFPPNRIPYGNKYPNITALRTGGEDPFTTVNLSYVAEWFAGFMYAWNMPMFFYLSGRNAYSALFRRTETQFRDQRVHRLLVPMLFFTLVGQLPYSVSYFSPHTPPLEISYWEYLRAYFITFDLHVAWFLLYLFLFSQLMTYWFTVFHPAHNKSESSELSCCGSYVCCCSIRPFNYFTRVFCCLNFLFRPTTTPEGFVSAVRWFLEGPIKFVLVPGGILALLEVSHNLTPFMTIIGLKFFAIFFQFTTTFCYLLIFVLGYATASADKFIKQEGRLWGWTCFISGVILCVLYGVVAVIDKHPIQYGTKLAIVAGFARGFGQWLFISGSLSLARRNFAVAKSWHSTFREMAMPFYLVHQWVINPVTAGALWVPYLRTFPVMLLITSVLAGALSFLITRSGPVRYFFGLPPSKESCLPGPQLRGFVPVLVLAGIVIVTQLLAHLL